MPITSPHNDKLKTVRKLRQRRRDRERLGQFVAEGEDLLAAADAAGWKPIERFCVTGSGLPGIEVEPELLAGVTELASGTRTLAIYTERWRAVEDIQTASTCVYLHGVSDPGNVGTVLRAAAAFGAGCVAFGKGSADPFSPKAVRASMGAIFTVAVVRAAGSEPRTVASQLPGVTVALDASAERTLAEVMQTLDSQKEVTLLVGAEREGLPDELLSEVDHVARIPIVTESLNAAMAATVALYELTRPLTRGTNS